MAVKVKLKPHTSEIIEQTAEKSGEPIVIVREVFHAYWGDIRTALFSCTGHSIYVEQWGTFFFNITRLRYILKKKFERLVILLRYIKEKTVMRNLHKRNINNCLKLVTEIVIIIESFKLYEREIGNQVNPKGKPDKKAIEEYTKRMEELFDIPFSELQVTVTNTIQKSYVQKLRKSGFLPNPVVYQNKEM